MLKKLVVMLIMTAVIATGVQAALYSDMQIGARASALGGAFVSAARDADAVYWNPAALGIIKKSTIAFMYSDIYNAGINESYLAYSQPMNQVGLGANWLRHSVDLSEGLGATFKTNSWVDDLYSLGAGIKVKPDIYAGIVMKRYKIKSNFSNIQSIGTSGTGFDLGLLLTNLVKKESLDIENVSLGFQIRNLATDLSGENVDPSYKLGISTNIFSDFLFAFEIDMDNDNEDQSTDMKLRAGLEYTYKKILSIRIGSNDGSFSTGFGLLLKEKLGIDYVYEKDLGDLDKDNHRFSLSLQF